MEIQLSVKYCSSATAKTGTVIYRPGSEKWSKKLGRRKTKYTVSFLAHIPSFSAHIPHPIAFLAHIPSCHTLHKTGQDIQEEPLRQPVVPELAISLGPMSMAISGACSDYRNSIG